VLDYHAVSPSQREKFDAQMETLMRLAMPVPASQQDQLESGKSYAAITFDDAFRCIFENALPVLQKRGIPSTVFVPVGSLGGKPTWIASSCETVISAQELASMGHNPLLAIGSHSMSHPHFPQLTESQARREFQQSKAELEQLLGRAVELFSFPYGAYGDESIRLAKETGYKRVFSIDPKPAELGTKEFLTGRVLVSPEDWPIEFRLKVLGSYRWLMSARKLKNGMLKAGAQGRD
jgi:peptidoglycan/xylan/chitin deacetylase (PgdA/CDA1 family)